MEILGALLILFGFLVFAGAIIMFIYHTLKSEKKFEWNPLNKKWAKIGGYAFAALLIGIIIFPNNNNQKETPKSQVTEAASQVEKAKAEEAAKVKAEAEKKKN